MKAWIGDELVAVAAGTSMFNGLSWLQDDDGSLSMDGLRGEVPDFSDLALALALSDANSAGVGHRPVIVGMNVSGAGFALGILGSVACGGGGPMDVGGTRSVTPGSWNVAPP